MVDLLVMQFCHHLYFPLKFLLADNVASDKTIEEFVYLIVSLLDRRNRLSNIV